jgi:nucleoside phosphorylase
VMNILIVDDSAGKTEEISQVIREAFLSVDEISIDTSINIHDAYIKVTKNSYDLMLVDLNIPMRAGEEAKEDAGAEFVATLGNRAEIKRPTHIIGLTEFDGLAQRHRNMFHDRMWHILLLNRGFSDWSRKLRDHLMYLRPSWVEDNGSRFRFGMAIMVALESVEYNAIKRLPFEWERYSEKGDPTVYFVGKKPGESAESRSVILAAQTRMGSVSSAVLATKIIYTFRPRYLVMTGIAAGFEGAFGDILVAESATDCAAGKIQEADASGSEFLPAPSEIAMDQILRGRIAEMVYDDCFLASIRSKWPGEAPAKLSAKIGPFACVSSVIDSEVERERLLRLNRKFIAIEMEIFGVYLAASTVKQPIPSVMAIKSLCDYANGKKHKKYQAYAAFTSSWFLHEFALKHIWA